MQDPRLPPVVFMKKRQRFFKSLQSKKNIYIFAPLFGKKVQKYLFIFGVDRKTCKIIISIYFFLLSKFQKVKQAFVVIITTTCKSNRRYLF